MKIRITVFGGPQDGQVLTGKAEMTHIKLDGHAVPLEHRGAERWVAVWAERKPLAKEGAE